VRASHETSEHSRSVFSLPLSHSLCLSQINQRLAGFFLVQDSIKDYVIWTLSLISRAFGILAWEADDVFHITPELSDH